MQPTYYSIAHLLSMVDEPNRSVCERILEENDELFRRVRGSSHNHQAWPGGYRDHVQEVMNIGYRLYNLCSGLRPLPFTRSDVLLILFLHDIEKPWKYTVSEGGLIIKPELVDKGMQKAFRAEKLRQYGIVLTPAQENAMRYVEGEHDDYSSKQRVMNELAALCHCADVLSARLWHNYPLAADDPWYGATRSVNDECT